MTKAKATKPKAETISETLNDRQKLFCSEYLIDFNATEAAKRAGYSEKTAYSIGHELLKKPEISNWIAAQNKATLEKVNITAEMVLREYAKIAFSDITKVVNEDGELLDGADGGLIKMWQVNKDTGSRKIQLHSKLPALKVLAQYTGIIAGGLPAEDGKNELYDEFDKDDND